MNGRYDIVVVGGGMVGLAAAGLLAQRGEFRVTLIDAGKSPVCPPADDIGLRVSAISPGSVEVLASIGAWAEIEKTRACPYREMKVWDASGSVDGPGTLAFAAAEYGIRELGFIVENELIRHAILRRLQETRVDVRFETPIDAVVRDGNRPTLQLPDGSLLRPDLLIGADGARSQVRRDAGIAVRSWPYGQHALVTCLTPQHSHRNTAWQRFLEEGPIGMLPLSDGRVSIVWSTTPDMASAALELSDAALSERLTEVTDGVLGKLTVAGPRGAFPLKSQHAVEYVQDGLALIGDAAHTVHPLAGQGVNLGFADAQELAETLVSALTADEHPGDFPTLRQYERARKGDNQKMLLFVDGLNRLFSNRSTSLARLRGFGMFLFNRSGPVRDRAVRTALGIR